jgi:hypothetical protein
MDVGGEIYVRLISRRRARSRKKRLLAVVDGHLPRLAPMSSALEVYQVLCAAEKLSVIATGQAL